MTATAHRQVEGDQLWADEDWVPDAVRKQAARRTRIILAITVIGGALYLGGLFLMIGALPGLILVLAAFVCWLLLLALLPFWYAYRPTSTADLQSDRIFHISRALWEPGQDVTLQIDLSRKRQFIAGKIWGRRTRLVYFFPRRPTQRHARGQTFHVKRREPRYLYELELVTAPERLYSRGSAMGAPNDLHTRVIRRQSVPSTNGESDDHPR